MTPDGSGWTAEEDWRTRAWNSWDEGTLPDFPVPALPVKGHLTVELDDASLTAERSGLGEPRERG